MAMVLFRTRHGKRGKIVVSRGTHLGLCQWNGIGFCKEIINELRMT